MQQQLPLPPQQISVRRAPFSASDLSLTYPRTAGPVMRDRQFFFGGYTAVALSTTQAGTITTRSG